jgi:hypothetical protein
MREAADLAVGCNPTPPVVCVVATTTLVASSSLACALKSGLRFAVPLRSLLRLGKPSLREGDPQGDPIGCGRGESVVFRFFVFRELECSLVAVAVLSRAPGMDLWFQEVMCLFTRTDHSPMEAESARSARYTAHTPPCHCPSGRVRARRCGKLDLGDMTIERTPTPSTFLRGRLLRRSCGDPEPYRRRRRPGRP